MMDVNRMRAKLKQPKTTVTAKQYDKLDQEDKALVLSFLKEDIALAERHDIDVPSFKYRL